MGPLLRTLIPGRKVLRNLRSVRNAEFLPSQSIMTKTVNGEWLKGETTRLNNWPKRWFHDKMFVKRRCHSAVSQGLHNIAAFLVCRKHLDFSIKNV